MKPLTIMIVPRISSDGQWAEYLVAVESLNVQPWVRVGVYRSLLDVEDAFDPGLRAGVRAMFGRLKAGEAIRLSAAHLLSQASARA
jgi:hypothetical protein